MGLRRAAVAGQRLQLDAVRWYETEAAVVIGDAAGAGDRPCRFQQAVGAAVAHHETVVGNEVAAVDPQAAALGRDVPFIAGYGRVLQGQRGLGGGLEEGRRILIRPAAGGEVAADQCCC